MREPKFLSAVVVLPVADMQIARDWYAHVLGWQTVFLNADPVEDPAGNYAILRRDDAEVHLILDEPPRDHPWKTAGTGYLFLLVQDVVAAYEELRAKSVAVTSELQTQDWGARAFQLTDPSGNRILVAETLGS